MEALGRARHPSFRFFERSAQGELRVLGPKESFHAVLFVEPLRGNEVALGYSARWLPTRRAMVAQALRSGELSASGRITLIQETSNQFGILVVAPVPGTAQRPPGLVQGVFRCGDLVAKSLAFLEPKASTCVSSTLGLVRGGPAPRGEDAAPPRAGRLLRPAVRSQLPAGRSDWRVEVVSAPATTP